MSSRKKASWCWLVIVTLITASGTVDLAAASPENVICVDPPIIWDTEYDIGDPLSINITVDYVRELWCYQFEMSFNPDVLHGVSVENGDFLGSAIPPPLRPYYILVFEGLGFDNAEGTLSLFGAAIRLMPPPPLSYYPTGSGVLATVTFEVVGYGLSGLVLGRNTLLFDKDANEMPASEPPQHGLFKNTENAPELYIRGRGGRVWPEWHMNIVGEPQTLYCRVKNYGDEPANVKVKFTMVFGLPYWYVFSSDLVWIEACVYDPETDDIIPGEVVVSVSLHAWMPTVFYISAKLYLGYEEYPYEMIEDLWGGEGTCMHAFKFKAVTEMDE